jgi:hypothetical protein
MQRKHRGEKSDDALGKLTGEELRAQRGRSARATAAGGLRKPWRPRRGCQGEEQARGRRE